MKTEKKENNRRRQHGLVGKTYTDMAPEMLTDLYSPTSELATERIAMNLMNS